MVKCRLFMVLAALVCLSLFSLGAFAAEADTSGEEIIRYEDGSYFAVTYVNPGIRTAKTQTGSKIYTYYDSDDVVRWEAVLTGTFTHNGTTSACTSSSCSVTIYDNDWYVVSKSASKSGNTATAEVTMGYKVLGVTVSTKPYSLTLTCDKNGSLS